MVQVSSGNAAIPGLNDFLDAQPFISIRPSRGDALLLDGDFRFTAQTPGSPPITDSYGLLISVPQSFPRDLPTITETEGRIPRSPNYHVNSDGTLCLGSPMRLMARLQEEPSLQAFSRNCIVPYLYAVTNALKSRQKFLFGELNHGTPGEMEDYKELLGLKSSDQVPQALRCILKKKRIANKMKCPCECGLRLGRCRFNQTIKHFRSVLPKTWLREKFGRLTRSLSGSLRRILGEASSQSSDSHQNHWSVK